VIASMHSLYPSTRRLPLIGCFILLLHSFSGAAQTVPVKGTVRSANGELLPGVSIVADSLNGVTTGTDGSFSLLLTPAAHTLVFRLLGFKELTRKISLEGKSSDSLAVVLTESTRELGVVVVTAGRHEQKIEDVTVSMEVIKPSLVENTNATTMESVVDQVPGVNVIDGQANIRGGAGWSYGAGSRVLVLVDDMPQLSADAADAKWTFIPTENLEQIEVIKGASSALFGSSALNGVINFRTAYPRDTPQTKVGVYSGIYDKPILNYGDTSYNLKWWGTTPQFISGLNFLHSRQIGRLDLVAGGNILIDDGYRQGENEGRYRFNMNLRWRTPTEGLSAGLNFNIQTATGALFFIWKNDTTGAYIPADNTLSEYTNNKYSFDPYLTYLAKNGGSHKFRSRIFINTNDNNTNQNSNSTAVFAEYQYQRRYLQEKLTLTGGLAEQYSQVHSELYKDHNGNNLSAYIQGDAKVNRFNFSMGARVEQNRVDEDSDSPQIVFRAGVNYHLLKETYLRASAGQGYRFPSVAEQFIGTTVGGIGIYPNDSLDPESGFSTEFGIKQGLKIGQWQGYLDVAAFLNRYNNMLEFTFAQWGTISNPLGGYGFSSINIGNTEIKGIEFSATGSGRIAKNLQLDVLAGYTYIDPRQISYSDAYIEKAVPDYVMGSDSSNFLKYRYQHLVRLDAEFTFQKAAFGSSLRYNSFMVNVDKFFVDEVGDQLTPGVGNYREHRRQGDLVCDMRISYLLAGHLKAAFICKNVFNYIFMQRPADMQPPRTFVLQVNYSM